MVKKPEDEFDPDPEAEQEEGYLYPEAECLTGYMFRFADDVLSQVRCVLRLLQSTEPVFTGYHSSRQSSLQMLASDQRDCPPITCPG